MLHQASSGFIRLPKHPTSPPQRSTAQRKSSACVVHSPPWVVASRITASLICHLSEAIEPINQDHQDRHDSNVDQSEPHGWPFRALLQSSGACDNQDGNQLNQLCYSLFYQFWQHLLCPTQLEAKGKGRKLAWQGA